MNIRCPDCGKATKAVTSNGYVICSRCLQSIKVVNGKVGNAFPRDLKRK